MGSYLFFYVLASTTDSPIKVKIPETPPMLLVTATSVKTAQTIVQELEDLLNRCTVSQTLRMYCAFNLADPSKKLRPLSTEQRLHATLYESESELTFLKAFNFLLGLLTPFEHHPNPLLTCMVDSVGGKLQAPFRDRGASMCYEFNLLLEMHKLLAIHRGVNPIMEGIVVAMQTYLNGEYNVANFPFLHVALNYESEKYLRESGFENILFNIEGLRIEFNTDTHCIKVLLSYNTSSGWQIKVDEIIYDPLRDPFSMKLFTRIEDNLAEWKETCDFLRKAEYYLAAFESEFLVPDICLENLKAEKNSYFKRLPPLTSIDQARMELEKLRTIQYNIGFRSDQNLTEKHALIGEIPDIDDRRERFSVEKKFRHLIGFYTRELSFCNTMVVDEEFILLRSILSDWLWSRWKLSSTKNIEEYFEGIKELLIEQKELLGKYIPICEGARRSTITENRIRYLHPVEIRLQKEPKINNLRMKIFISLLMRSYYERLIAGIEAENIARVREELTLLEDSPPRIREETKESFRKFPIAVVAAAAGA